MFNVFMDINWLSVLICSVIYSFTGGIWFAVLFSKQYAEALGREYNPKDKPGMLYIIGPYFCGLITIATMAVLIYALNISTISNALIFGGIVGVGFIASTSLNTAINPNFPRPFYYSLLNGSYFLLTSLISCAIIVWMK